MSTIKITEPILLLVLGIFNQATFKGISENVCFIKHWVIHCSSASDDYSTMAHTLLPSPCMKEATNQKQRMVSAWTER